MADDQKGIERVTAPVLPPVRDSARPIEESENSVERVSENQSQDISSETEMNTPSPETMTETSVQSVPILPEFTEVQEDQPVVHLDEEEPPLTSVTEPLDVSFIEQPEIPSMPSAEAGLSLEIDNPAPQPVEETQVIAPVSSETSDQTEPQKTGEKTPEQPSGFPVEKVKSDAAPTLSGTNTPTIPAKTEVHKRVDYTASTFLKELFANGNECITAPGGSYQISDTTRSMLALFSNGRYFVAETHKYDGPPLLFVTDTRRRRLQIGQPEYVPLVVINNIYEYAAKLSSKTHVEPEENNQEQARMQRDFVTIVAKAAASHVSDIHIVVADHTTVMFRMNGLMQTEMEYNKEWGESFVRAAFASADISDANYAQNEYQAAQKVGKTALRGSNGKLLLPKNVQGIRLQFNPIAFGTRYVVMRLLYDEENAESAGDLSILGFEAHEVETFYRLRAIPTGIVIVAGPTGSGKSTTLQRNMISMLQERNYELNLITVEDPPEYPIPGARQMPVTNASTEELKDREFTKALAASLRSDPDALMIGEVRTLAAADLAFRGALSGHSVWTTLHANSAPAIMMRLKDMGVEDFKLQDPSIMKGMLSQRLFRKICPYCRIPATDKLDSPAVGRLRQSFGDIGVELSYLRGPGCKHCEYRGVKGRTVVGEFLLPDATFLDLMIRGESKKAMDYWVTELNGRTLREAAQSRMLRGLIDIDEVERWTGLFTETAA